MLNDFTEVAWITRFVWLVNNFVAINGSNTFIPKLYGAPLTVVIVNFSYCKSKLLPYRV